MILSEVRIYILNNYFDTAGNKLNRWKKKEAEEFLKDFSGKNFSEKVYRILHGITDICKCPCGNELEFRGFQIGYAKFCSRVCSGKYTAKKASITKKERFSDPKKKNEFIRKQKATKKKRYGSETYNNREGAKKTCKQRYGVDNPSYIPGVVEKIIKTKRKKSKFKDRYIQTHLSYDTICCLQNKQWLKDAVSVYSVLELSKILSCSFTFIYKKCKEIGVNFSYKQSLFECDVINFIESFYKGKIIKNSRDILDNNFELDIYIPEYNLAIECDGVFWHSEELGKDRKYHLMKTEICEKKRIQLLHIFDNEWIQKNKIWKSIILSKIGIFDKKIGARKCNIKEISYKECERFLIDNHLQGSIKVSVRYGLFYNNELVSVMAFNRTRFSKKYDWELVRFCSKCGYQIYGAASKMLSHFKKEYKGVIVSYANRRWSNGSLYNKIGFKYITKTDPNYFYFKNRGHSYLYTLESRMKYQKHKQQKCLKIFDNALSEYQNMRNNDYFRIWDCGNLIYLI